MSDDHTSQAIGAYATLLKSIDPTPTIDRLAKEGICFDNAFCTNGICTPSRACIITGQYNHNNGVFDLGGRIEKNAQTLPILMREAGYQTAMIGKWHLKAEPNFDYYKVLPGQGSYFDTSFRIQGAKPWPKNTIQYPGSHSSDVITDATLDWLKDHRDPKRPFFICHQYKAPHDFFESHPRYDAYLADQQIPEPESLWHKSETWGSLATRGFNDELVPHIGTSIGGKIGAKDVNILPLQYDRMDFLHCDFANSASLCINQLKLSGYGIAFDEIGKYIEEEHFLLCRNCRGERRLARNAEQDAAKPE